MKEMKKIFLLARTLLLCFMVIGFEQAPLRAQDGLVRVTATRANIRSEPSDKAPVLLQVVVKTILTLKAIEGDWYRVQIPPDPRLGPVRIEAYISSKVATIVTPLGPAAPRRPMDAAPAPLPEPEGTRDGVSVAFGRDNTLTFMDSSEARLRIAPAKSDAFRTLAATLPLVDEPFDPDAAAPVIYAWSIDGVTSSTVVSEKRPSLIVLFKNARDLAPDDLVPVLVRLTPTISGVRVVGFVKARADQPSRIAADWDVMKDLKQDVIRTTLVQPESGAANLQLTTDLAPGEYAVVLRPNGRTKLSGASVLAIGPVSRVFTAAWTFSVR